MDAKDTNPPATPSPASASTAPTANRIIGSDDSDYRLIVDDVADYAIFLLDAGGFIQSWNEGARRIKGYEPDEIIGRHIRIFYPEALIAKGWPDTELATARATGRFEDEGWRIRKDGTRFWANIVITRLVDAEGRFRGFSKITRDLTERRRHEETLRASEERFRLLVEGVHDYAIFMLDPSGHIVSWNAGAQRIKGYTTTEILGKHFSIFYPDDVVNAGWPAEELRRAMKDGHFEDEGWRVRKDGSRFWGNVTITALYDETGRHRGFAKVTRDLTDKRRITSLEDEGRRITHFLAMLGHELRNPLAPISNALSIIEMAGSESEQIRMAQAVIGRQLKQMIRLVDDLLDMGRIASGKIHLESKLVDLREAVAEAIETVEPLRLAKSHSLKLALEGADLWVSGDKARIVQVITNLLNNAIKFTPNNGEITVTLRRNGPDAEILIRDSGVGIPHHLLKDIFKPFVQAEQDAARSQGGLGLGLSLVQQIVSLHDGTVAAWSPGHVGSGSEFVVTLPMVAAPVDAFVDATSPARGRGKKVLVVDDNADAAETLRMVVAGLGYEATVANDGYSAIEMIKGGRPDVVLLDIGLPGLSGIDVAKKIRQEMISPPALIAVTAYGLDKDRDVAFKAGFNAYLTKPANIAELSQLLRQMLV